MHHIAEVAGKVGVLHGGSWSAQDSIALAVIVAGILLVGKLFKSKNKSEN